MQINFIVYNEMICYQLANLFNKSNTAWIKLILLYSDLTTTQFAGGNNLSF